MNYQEAQKKLSSLNQNSLLEYWEFLSLSEQKTLLQNISFLDGITLSQQIEILKEEKKKKLTKIEPFEDFSIQGNREDQIRGQDLISKGEMGCIIVAGGQGTRLGFNGPKGAFPLSLIRHKSLFQLFSEKTLAASKKYKIPLQLAIMTSPINHEDTVAFFESNQFFGLNPGQIDFFTQGVLPFLDAEGKLFLETPTTIAQGPDGNGLALHHFWKSKIGPQWKAKGIRYVNFVPIDNPLADPFDSELVGFHERNQNEITLKCTQKRHGEEKVGVIVKEGEKIRIQEYSEMSEKNRNEINSNGVLKYSCANLSLFCFDISFIERTSKKINLPLHIARKPAVSSIRQNDKFINKTIMANKFEYFIFDVLMDSHQIKALLYPRELCFAPLKEKEGENGLVAVQKAMSSLDNKIFHQYCPQCNLIEPFELSQEFYYPTPPFLKKYQNQKKVYEGYMD